MASPLAPHVLDIDPADTAARTETALTAQVGRQQRRRGVVVAVSGGVDSAVCAALATRALGPRRVHALLLPEADSDPGATDRARKLCEALDVTYDVEDIGPALEALGCYRRRDAAIRRLFPDYGPGWRQKITLAGGLDPERVPYFDLTVAPPGAVAPGDPEAPEDGDAPGDPAAGTGTTTARMPADVYLDVVAATNMKQRTRKLVEQYHAEARNFAVLGTPNRLEYELGFFVRGGDGLADLKPIAHLYKTQVYALAAHLGLPEEIRRQPPTTDTYSLPQTQEEFYFTLPYDRMDLALWAWHHDVPAAEAAADLGLTPEQMERVYRDIVAKRRTAGRLLQHAALVEQVEVG